MKAIILARVSDKKQDSNEAQVVRVSDYVKFKGLTAWKTYEIEESSTKGDREKYQEAVKDVIDSKEPVALVVDTVDRLQRSFKESVQLDELRKSGKLEIHFYRENLILNKDSNSSDLLRWDMAVMFARSYVLQLSDNVKRKQEQMRKNGEWTGRPPIGYESVYDTTGKRIDIIPDPQKAHFIQKMFELYARKSYSTITLRVEIARQGLKTDLGKPLAPSLIDHILNNTFYYGLAYSKEKDISWNHKYKPLITKELFDKCQEIRTGWGKKPFQYASKPFIFRGLVRCAKCGCSMSPEIAKGKFIYYSCTNARKGICNKKVYVPESSFLKPVYEVLRAFNAIPQAKIDEIVEGLKKSNEGKDLYHKEAVKALRQEYDTVQARLSRLTDFLLDERITTDEYDKKLKELKEKQHDIDIQLQDHTYADENYYITASTILNLAKGALELFESLGKSSNVPKQRDLLNFLLQNCVANGKNLEFSLRSPFNHILTFTKQPIGLRDQGSNLGHPPYIDPKIS
ncbi:MAG: recombinase family protein [Candidatus Woesearchaeota archaeon]|nr:recombinase family protein [Candidatus Woesearchaeota archaeon]